MINGLYRIALPITPSHSHPLPPIFQEKQPTPIYFLTKTSCSHPFLIKKTPLPPIFLKNRRTPTHFLSKTTSPYPFFYQNHPLPHYFPTHLFIKTPPSQPFLRENDPLPPSFNKNNSISSIFQ